MKNLLLFMKSNLNFTQDYVVCLQEHEFDSRLENDPINFTQVKQSFNSYKQIEAMENEMKFMKNNDVWDWDLVELLKGTKLIGCKWILRQKGIQKAMLRDKKNLSIAKGFTQKEDINFKKTFSPVSTKDYFRIIMTLVAYFDLKLYQMDVKNAFLNGDIEETIYMVQLENFVSRDSKNMVCILKKFIYGLK